MEKSKEMKKPLVQSLRVMTNSKESMSGRPVLSFRFTWMGPDVHEVERRFVFLGSGGDGEDSAVYAHVADLGFVGDAVEGDLFASKTFVIHLPDPVQVIRSVLGRHHT